MIRVPSVQLNAVAMSHHVDFSLRFLMLTLSSVGNWDIFEAVIKLLSVRVVFRNIGNFTIVDCSIRELDTLEMSFINLLEINGC